MNKKKIQFLLIAGGLALAGIAAADETESAPDVAFATGLPAAATPNGGADVIARAWSEFNNQQLELAARELDAWLVKNQKDTAALRLRAFVAERAGNIPAALLCTNLAIAFLPAETLQQGAPSNLIDLQSRLFDSLLKSDPNQIVPPPPDWSWPPMPKFVPQGATEDNGSTTAQVTTAKDKPISAQIVPTGQLLEAAILKDAHGQWAEKAKASSEYGSDNYGVVQATGAPDVTSYADNGRAWASASADNQEEWLELTYAKAVNATGVRVRQTFNPGAIKQIEIYDEAGQSHVVWSGLDPARGQPADITWFGVQFPATPFKTQRVRITVDSPAVKGWNEIDAVQLVGE